MRRPRNRSSVGPVKAWLVVAAVLFGLLDVLLAGSGPPGGLAPALLVDASLVLLPRFPGSSACSPWA